MQMDLAAIISKSMLLSGAKLNTKIKRNKKTSSHIALNYGT
jgi:hypothetical protein